MQAERALLLVEGLPGRPWYKHIVYAPSAVDYYAGSAFPGIVDALAAGDEEAVLQQLSLASLHVAAAAASLAGCRVVGDAGDACRVHC